VALLREAGVELLVDVRTVPRSRTNPQFNADTLPQALDAAGIGYRHIAARRLFRGSVLRRSLSTAKTGQERQNAAQAEASHNGGSPTSSSKVPPRRARSDSLDGR